MIFFKLITYDTPKIIKVLNDFFIIIKYKIARPIISSILYYTKYESEFVKIAQTETNKQLKKGVSVYIPVKDEECFLKMCLNSLMGKVDQFILIDNGSTDNSLKIMEDFKNKHSGKIEIEVYSKPEMLLVEMVQFALTKVKYKLVLKWDGDMYALNELNNYIKIALKSERPLAYGLPRLNLCGDFNHINKYFPVIDGGEPFLRHFNNEFIFKEEFGRLEHAVIPIYYKYKTVKKICSIHFSRIRPMLRLIYRDIYLDWRQVYNNGDQDLKNKYNKLFLFEQDWYLHNFGTTDLNSIKFRVGRFFAEMSIRYDEKKYISLPDELQDLIKEDKHQFKIIYQNNKPYQMIDRFDKSLVGYIPSEEDIKWSKSKDDYYNDKKRLSFTRLFGKQIQK